MTERDAILATLDEYADAYCAKDMNRLMQLFDQSNDISIIGTGKDELCSGPSDIRKLFGRNFADATANGFGWGWRHVTISDDFALIAIEVSLDIETGGKQTIIPLRWTVALKRRPDGWKWLHRNASVAAGGQRSGQAYPTGEAK